MLALCLPCFLPPIKTVKSTEAPEGAISTSYHILFIFSPVVALVKSSSSEYGTSSLQLILHNLFTAGVTRLGGTSSSH